MPRQVICSIKIRTVDTDVVLIAIALFSRLNLNELWIEFDTGNSKVFYPVHLICNNLGSKKSKALLFFSCIYWMRLSVLFQHMQKGNCGKTRKSYPEVTDKFINLGDLPLKEPADKAFPIIERFTALMYKRTNNAITVDEARREMFLIDGRDLETIPPTPAALLEHTFRAAYIAGHVWNNAFVPSPDLPQPNEWGWIRTGDGYKSLWTKLPERLH